MLYSIVSFCFIAKWISYMYTCVCVSCSCVQLFVTPRTVALQTPLSMEFSRQEYWSGQLFPSLYLPHPVIKPRSSALQANSLPSEPGQSICINIYPLFSGFSSHIGPHRALCRVPCAIQQVLISYLVNSVQMSIPISQLIPLPLPLQVSMCLFPMSVYFISALQVRSTIPIF